MRFQKHTWSCGSCAVVNALRAQSISVAERNVIPVSETTEDGTSHVGIIRAVKHFGGVVEEYSSSKKSQAWTWLHGSLVHGSSVILCVDSWGHWVAVVGALGDRVVLIDSGQAAKNVNENGVHIVPKRTLMTRWWNGRAWVKNEGFDHRLYAIQVRRKKRS